MGKAQSKGSAEITTEPSKEIQEGSGKLKKLDDTYFKENESSDKENKVANDAAENEKNDSLKVEDSKATTNEDPAPETLEIKVEEPLLDEKAAEEIKEATLDPDSAAKPKKEKVKRKWSLRNLSFGKKDKQKPSKKDKKNEENKVVAESSEEKLGEDKEVKTTETVEEKAKDVEIKTEVLETVIEAAVVEIAEEIKSVEAPAPAVEAPAPAVEAPAPAVEEPIRSKTPEPIVEVVKEEKVEESTETEEVIEIKAPVIEIENPTPIEEEPVAIEEPVIQPPAIPATSPPSQFSVFAESMNIQTVEETITETVSTTTTEIITETQVEVSKSEIEEIDLKPVSDMIEAVLEQAVDHVESELTEKADGELPPPPPPVFDEIEAPVEIAVNGNGEHIEEPVETVKLENGVHHDIEDINDSEPMIEELKKEDKVSDKMAQDSPLAPEIISE